MPQNFLSLHNDIPVTLSEAHIWLACQIAKGDTVYLPIFERLTAEMAQQAAQNRLLEQAKAIANLHDCKSTKNLEKPYSRQPL